MGTRLPRSIFTLPFSFITTCAPSGKVITASRARTLMVLLSEKLILWLLPSTEGFSRRSPSVAALMANEPTICCTSTVKSDITYFSALVSLPTMLFTSICCLGFRLLLAVTVNWSRFPWFPAKLLLRSWGSTSMRYILAPSCFCIYRKKSSSSTRLPTNLMEPSLTSTPSGMTTSICMEDIMLSSFWRSTFTTASPPGRMLMLSMTTLFSAQALVQRQKVAIRAAARADKHPVCFLLLCFIF